MVINIAALFLTAMVLVSAPIQARAQSIPLDPLCGIITVPNKKLNTMQPVVKRYYDLVEHKTSEDKLSKEEVSSINSMIAKYAACTCGNAYIYPVKGNDEDGQSIEGTINACSKRSSVTGSLTLQNDRKTDFEGHWTGDKQIAGSDEYGKSYDLHVQ